MAEQHESAYGFDEWGFGPVKPGTNLLVAGPGEPVRKFLCSAIQPASDAEAGVVVSTVFDADELTDAIGDRRPRENQPVGIVDCAGGPAVGNDVRSADPSDLSGVGMQFSGLYDEIQRSGWGRIRAGVLSLPELFAAADGSKPVFRLLHSVTSRVRRSNGVGLYAMETDGDYGDIDGKTVQGGITHAFDGCLRVESSVTGPSVELE